MTVGEAKRVANANETKPNPLSLSTNPAFIARRLGPKLCFCVPSRGRAPLYTRTPSFSTCKKQRVVSAFYFFADSHGFGEKKKKTCGKAQFEKLRPAALFVSEFFSLIKFDS